MCLAVPGLVISIVKRDGTLTTDVSFGTVTKQVCMAYLPDITAYLSALEPRIVGQPLTHIRIASPFLLRTVQPRIEAVEGHTVTSLQRIGKRENILT